MEQTEATPGGLGPQTSGQGCWGHSWAPRPSGREKEGEEESEEGRGASSRLPQGWDHPSGEPLDNSWGKPFHLVGGRRCPLWSQCACGLTLSRKATGAHPTAGWDGSPLDGAGARALAGPLRRDGSLRDPCQCTGPGWGGPTPHPRNHLCTFVSVLLPSLDQPLMVSVWHAWDQLVTWASLDPPKLEGMVTALWGKRKRGRVFTCPLPPPRPLYWVSQDRQAGTEIPCGSLSRSQVNQA